MSLVCFVSLLGCPRVHLLIAMMHDLMQWPDDCTIGEGSDSQSPIAATTTDTACDPEMIASYYAQITNVYKGGALIPPCVKSALSNFKILPMHRSKSSFRGILVLRMLVRNTAHAHTAGQLVEQSPTIDALTR